MNPTVIIEVERGGKRARIVRLYEGERTYVLEFADGTDALGATRWHAPQHDQTSFFLLGLLQDVVEGNLVPPRHDVDGSGVTVNAQPRPGGRS